LSAEKYFATEAEKHYFVFTDSQEIFDEKNNQRIHKIDQQVMGWPYDTLKRYEMFSTQESELQKYDYIVFFNANLLFLESVTADEFLPIKDNEDILACLHPVFYKKDKKTFTYEKNPLSKAYVDINQNKDYSYYQGAINGGKAKPFLDLIKKLQKNIDEDLEKKIISVWWDESHWNKYLNENTENLKVVSPSYLYPENFNLDLQPKILIRNKDQFGHLESVRNIKIKLSKSLLKSLYTKVKNKIIYTLFKTYDSIFFNKKNIFRFKNDNSEPNRRISVVITYFNRHETIHKTLYNIIFDNRVGEILIVDDHSTEESFAYLQNLAKELNNPKIKILRNEVNLGMFKNKIHAISQANNEWLILLDSDNTLTKKYLDSIFKVQSWDLKTMYCPSFAWPLINNESISGMTYNMNNLKNKLIHNSTTIKQFLNLGNFFVNKTEFTTAVDGYKECIPYAADSIFINYVWLSKDNNICIPKDCRYIHRVNPDSTWKAENIKSAVKFENIKNAILTLEKNPKKIV
jgi:hypothetical protein